jgi:hypothetical protein
MPASIYLNFCRIYYLQVVTRSCAALFYLRIHYPCASPRWASRITERYEVICLAVVGWTKNLAFSLTIEPSAQGLVMTYPAENTATSDRNSLLRDGTIPTARTSWRWISQWPAPAEVVLLLVILFSGSSIIPYGEWIQMILVGTYFVWSTLDLHFNTQNPRREDWSPRRRLVTSVFFGLLFIGLVLYQFVVP